ncbi:MAG: hypothetical protein EBE86_026970 [Hormoscilla sp. GUM202]|nr:hypothetical protein [Hormoscilla sp. GUM202]MBO1350791.1 hypothetical protein [Hormoscilla sp. GUM202]
MAGATLRDRTSTAHNLAAAPPQTPSCVPRGRRWERGGMRSGALQLSGLPLLT